jgi:solute:Na+ symporter, SSS family
LHLNITGTIFLAGALFTVIGGLYWKRANVLGGYLAMVLDLRRADSLLVH